MCKIKDLKIGIRKLDFTAARGKMTVYLTDGRVLMIPLSFFPEIKKLSLRQRNEWMVLDDQFFTFVGMSKVYSVTDLLKL